MRGKTLLVELIATPQTHTLAGLEIKVLHRIFMMYSVSTRFPKLTEVTFLLLTSFT